MSLVDSEHVLVVPTELFHRIGHFQGFCADVDRYLDVLLCPEHVSYRPRSQMEQDPSFKQLIPYMIFRYRPPGGPEQVFQYTRGRGQGEARLHRKRSIGIGGHICVDDAGPARSAHPYEEGMRRELAEEVRIDTPYQQRCVGMINDDQTDVGKVHLGVVHLFDVQEPRVVPCEEEIVDAGFRTADQLLAEQTGFETWSQICLEALFGAECSRVR